MSASMDCGDCQLAKYRKCVVNASLPANGCDILVVNKAPDSFEEREGVNAGRAGRKILQMLERIGVDPATVGFSYATRCRPKDDRPLRPQEVEACSKYLAQDIEQAKPNVIITVGAEALRAVAGDDVTINETHGEFLKSKYGVKVVPTTHPAFISTNWIQQFTVEHELKKAVAWAHTPKMPNRMGKEYRVITDIADAEAARDYILSNAKRLNFDFETEGFDIYDGDEILCLQVCFQAGEAFVFPLRGEWRRHVVDVYGDWQHELGYEKFIDLKQDDGRVITRNVMVKNGTGLKEGSIGTIIRPAFPAGSLVCRTPESHNRKNPSWIKGHKCRGYLTNILGGEQVTISDEFAGHPMRGKQVPADWFAMTKIIRELLTSDIPKVAQNGKFDIHVAQWQLGIRVRHFEIDTMQLFHLLREDVQSHNSEAIREHFTTLKNYDKGLKEIVSRDGSYAAVPNEMLWMYGCADVDVTERAVDPMWDEMAADNPEDGEFLFNNISMPLQRALAQIENNGILVDQDRLRELSKKYTAKIREFNQQLDTLCKEHNLTPIDSWGNDNQLRRFLFEKEYDHIVKKATKTLPEVSKPMRGLGLPSILAVKSKKTGENGTGKKTFTLLRRWSLEEVKYRIKMIRDREVRVATKELLSDREKKRRQWVWEILSLIQQYKVATKAKGTYLDGNGVDTHGMKAHIKSDGRVRCTYLQLTETARQSSSSPNLQNITNTSEDPAFADLGIRSMFIAQPGYDWIAADYNSQEIRIFAQLSEEPSMLKALHSCATCGEVFLPTDSDPDRPLKMFKHMHDHNHKAVDFHRQVGADVLHKPLEEVTDDERRKSKTTTFGILYGITEYGLSAQLGMPVSETKDFIEMYMKRYPLVSRYQTKRRKATRAGRNTRNAFGRIRHSELAKLMRGFSSGYDYDRIVQAMERERLNYPTQSTAGEVLSLDLIALADRWSIEDGDTSEAHDLSLDLMKEIGYDDYASNLLWNKGARLINSVHDSIDHESPPEATAESCSIIEQVMVGIPWKTLGWYLPVDINVGKFWGNK